MNREYDIFERMPDGSVEWRDVVVGREAAHTRLALLSLRSTNEFFAIHTPNKEMVERVNVPPQRE